MIKYKPPILFVFIRLNIKSVTGKHKYMYVYNTAFPNNMRIAVDYLKESIIYIYSPRLPNLFALTLIPGIT